jgi:hypothetical protein
MRIDRVKDGDVMCMGRVSILLLLNRSHCNAGDTWPDSAPGDPQMSRLDRTD